MSRIKILSEFNSFSNNIHCKFTVTPLSSQPPKNEKLNIYQFKMYITLFNSIVQFSNDVGCWSVSFSPRGYINRWPPGTYKQLIPTSTIISSIWSTFYIYQTSKGLLPCHLEIREVIQLDRTNRTHRNQW